MPASKLTVRARTGALLTALTVALLSLANPAKALENSRVCARAVTAAERAHDIPNALMTAISAVESGRWNADEKAVIAWPWTVTNGPDGQYFPTKDAAIAHVRTLQARGVRNIDVGCMQINLKYHPDAFDDLEAAFDPATNAAYAADFLTDLFAAHKSWGEAIRRYHSANKQFNRPYHQKVVRIWNDERGNSAEAHRQAVIAAHLARRAEIRAARARQLTALR